MSGWSQNVVRSVKKFYNGHPYQLSQETEQKPEQKTGPKNNIFLRDRIDEPVPSKHVCADPEQQPELILIVRNDMTTQTAGPVMITQGTSQEPEPEIPSSPMEEECTQTADYEYPCETIQSPPEKQQKQEMKDIEGTYIIVSPDNKKFKQCVLEKQKSRTDEDQWEYTIYCTHDSDIEEAEKPCFSKTDPANKRLSQTPDIVIDARDIVIEENNLVEVVSIEENNKIISPVESLSSDSIQCICTYEDNDENNTSVRKNSGSKEQEEEDNDDNCFM